jgi:alpha-glucosidase (family GH31 glycosyl hydrolase)
MDMRVTLWVHPFCNIDSYNFAPGAKSGYWVKDGQGKYPGFTSWWNGNPSVILDTTNSQAYDYFTSKLNQLKTKYGIDSFKFDAGETNWLPNEFTLYDNRSNPHVYSQNYVKIAHEQNLFVEARVGHVNQDKGIFYRILDRASDWTIHDGLKSVITATLHFSLLGYRYVLPDIIGGNGEIGRQKELFIRWAQLTAFMPSMQFGVPPWYFDYETDRIAKKFVDIHIEQVAPYIYELPLDAQPIIRPIWWLEPTNNQTFNISDQFMVGDDILVAPILDPNVTSRLVYLPIGQWYNIESKCVYNGPVYIKENVNIETIPYYYSKKMLNILNFDDLKFKISC